ncbi:DNA helicase UvrD [candidate division WOR-3 bacterium]|uniref:DNA helicase UvrD n=1 Tax=candidate division WOR-3 bacterium TaxID=2052148 RepID=A0A660SNN9_UNCW3|nr:MAG: DNA helicase UvrD [candidate division WOR-3 bacterium]
MRLIADLHIHSRFSRATSSEMNIERIAEAAKIKGIGLVATSDFTHPEWLAELKEKLKPKREGIYEFNGISFILNTEVNNNYTKGGRLRRIHNLIFAPSFEIVERINKKLSAYGNLAADGRPTLSLDSYEMFKMILDISEDCFLIPAHIWTPWFSLFGSNSGFDSIEECFEDLTDRIIALETGLSSDPAMNWLLSSLDRFALVSNSDAHSPNRLGREANVFAFEPDYYQLMEVLKEKDRKRFLFTIEFFPEEGKYHYDGHRRCRVRFSPEEAMMANNLCPECSRPLTIGVLHRVMSLADRKKGFVPKDAIPFKRLVPLDEIIAEAIGVGRDTVAVRSEFLKLCKNFGGEFSVLLDVPIEEIERVSNERIALAVNKVRNGDLIIEPGYDGEFGKIRIFPEGEEKGKKPQLSLF